MKKKKRPLQNSGTIWNQEAGTKSIIVVEPGKNETWLQIYTKNCEHRGNEGRKHLHLHDLFAKSYKDILQIPMQSARINMNK